MKRRSLSPKRSASAEFPRNRLSELYLGIEARRQELARRGMAASVGLTSAHFGGWASGVILDNGRPWILDSFQAAFLDDFFRGYAECWLIVPEGSGKTTVTAGLALHHIQHTSSGFVPVAASSRDQAEILFRQAEGLVRRSPVLKGKFIVQEGYRRIKCPATGGRIQIFAADERTGDGVIPTLCIIDELHRHRDLSLYRTWVGKLGKRSAQVVAISTAGEPGGEFELARRGVKATAAELTMDGCFTRAVSSGVVMHEWAVPAKADVTDLNLVKAANPLGTVTVESLKKKLASPTMTRAHWKRMTCNIATREESSAITAAEWAAAAVSDTIPPGESIWLGVDAGWKWDTFALVPLWAPDASFRLLGSATILVPPRDGTSLDVNLVKQAAKKIHEANPIELVVMDTNRAEDVAEWFRNVIGADVVDRAQSNSFAVKDYDAWMTALRSGTLHHTGDRGLTTHVLNAIAKTLPGGDTRFDRPKVNRNVNRAQQDQRVIDALVAAAMVHCTADAIFRRAGESTGPGWRPL